NGLISTLQRFGMVTYGSQIICDQKNQASASSWCFFYIFANLAFHSFLNDFSLVKCKIEL
nr:hypothetical protein [Bifidobacterium bifidum]